MENSGVFSIASQLPALMVVLAGILIFTVSASMAYRDMNERAVNEEVTNEARGLAEAFRVWNVTCPKGEGILETTALEDLDADYIVETFHPQHNFWVKIMDLDKKVLFFWMHSEEGDDVTHSAVVRTPMLLEDGDSRAACIVEVRVWE